MRKRLSTLWILALLCLMGCALGACQKAAEEIEEKQEQAEEERGTIVPTGVELEDTQPADPAIVGTEDSGAVEPTAEGDPHAMPQNTQAPGVETPPDHAAAMPASDVTRAIAVLHPTEGNNVTGTVTFVKTDQGVQIEANIQGLTPGQHGFHIHQWGDCSAPDATSAGGHYAPGDSPHGAPTDPADKRHVGDFGNIEANAEGVATYSRVDEHATFDGASSILGRGVVVHADPDDLTSQPTGNAGSRVACGVIGIADPALAQ